MEIEIEDFGEKTVVRVKEDRLDAAKAVQFKESLREVADQTPSAVVLDMSQVNFLDSSGLGAVVNVMKILGKDRPLQLAGLTPTVAKVFALTRMDKVMQVFSSVEEATDTGLRHAG
ncbi:MAG: STAS domain-containing protein [Pseudomonadota bacterium]